MESPAIQERVEFFLLKTAWGIEALLVASRSVTTGGLALGFSLGAFKDDDVSWHSLAEIGTRNL